MKEEVIEQEKETEVVDSIEEIEVETHEGEMLSLSTSHPQKNHKHLSIFLSSGELLPKVSNFKIRAFKEWVQDKSEGSPPSQIQISKVMNGKEPTRPKKTSSNDWCYLNQIMWQKF